MSLSAEFINIDIGIQNSFLLDAVGVESVAARVEAGGGVLGHQLEADAAFLEQWFVAGCKSQRQN